jgi:Xaa-Pro aminopeptidase
MNNIFKNRRNDILNQINDGVALIPSSMMQTRSNDTEFPFRQDSNFYYLSGFKESNSCLMIIKEKKKFKIILFVEKKDEKKELWNGERLGVKGARDRFLVDEIYTIDEFNTVFKNSLISKRVLYFDFKLDYSKVKTIKRYSKDLATYKNIALKIQKMRLIKSKNEIKLIKKAIDITRKAHHKVMKMDKVGKNEYELLASLEHSFKKRGAFNDAYTSIVASGNSANTLHYIKNNKPLLDNELILIDAGCEYEYYSSDITRTIPVNGKFTKAQKKLYTLVLEVENKIIQMIKDGVFRSELQIESERLLCKGLVKLGILNGKVKKLLKDKKYKKYYPHGIGHWMGIDVHDEAPYQTKKSKEIPLKAGMVLTIEPGIYCNKNDISIPKKYRGIGIRIEDDILVTKDGYINLSKKIIKNIEDIENLS